MRFGRHAATSILAALVAIGPSVVDAADSAQKNPSAMSAQVARGHYLVRIGGCNDCHTAGYAFSDGKVPEAQWLMGDTLGWRGPWGTTYPPNLRIYMQALTEAQWLKAAKSLQTRPPMPWFTVRQMSDADLRAIYAFIRQLGPVGKPAPSFVPPDKEPPPPFVTFPAPPPK